MSSLGRFPSDQTTQALRQHAGGQGTQSTKEKAGDVLMCSGFSGAERLHPIFIAEPLAKSKTLGLGLIGAAVVMMSLPRCEGICRSLAAQLESAGIADIVSGLLSMDPRSL
jgi:hypothetical protein